MKPLNFKKLTPAMVDEFTKMDQKLESMVEAEREDYGCLHNDIDHGMCMDCGAELHDLYDSEAS